MAHTPGTWAATFRGDDGWCVMSPAEPDTGQGGTGLPISWVIAYAANVSPSTPDSTVEANARLMAAAPDLLEALEGFLDWYNYGEGHDVPQRLVAPSTEARAAIAKARGVPS